MKVLNRIRKGKQEQGDIGYVNGGGGGVVEGGELAVSLYPTNAQADRENEQKLLKLKVFFVFCFCFVLFCFVFLLFMFYLN